MSGRDAVSTGSIRGQETSSTLRPQTGWRQARSPRPSATVPASWLTTTKGLSRYVPAPDEPLEPPRTLFSALRVGNAPQTVSALGESDIRLRDLPANHNQIQVDFVGLSYAPGEVLHYRYRLEGSGGDWSVPTEQRTVTYANLAPGHYHFAVHAISSEGLVSSLPATMTFTVLRPVWQRWYFVALAASALCLTLFVAYRYRVRRLLEVANMRTRIATDLHDDIGANLTRIAVLSEVVRQQSAGEDVQREGQLSSIARISRESIAAMGDIVWAINPQRDTLLDLVRRMREHAEEVCLPRNIDLTFRSPGAESPSKLGIDIRRDVYLIFKEAVNNALRRRRRQRPHEHEAASGSARRQARDRVARGRGHDHRGAAASHGAGPPTETCR